MWHSGNLILNKKEFHFDLLIFQEPSPKGINGGRIENLRVFDEKDNTVLDFDKGWIMAPDEYLFGKDILRLILLEFDKEAINL